MNDIQAAQVAMFWDSEGTIGVWAQKRKRRPRAVYFRIGMTAGNTNLALLESIRDDVGCGTINKEKQNNPNGKTFWRLTVSQREAQPILERILPYLRAKRRQAEIALEFLGLHANTGRRGISKDAWEKQRALYFECGPLNQRGIQAFQAKLPDVDFEYRQEYELKPYVRTKFKPTRFCEQPDCGIKHYAKGMCFKHYRKANPQIYGRKKLSPNG